MAVQTLHSHDRHVLSAARRRRNERVRLAADRGRWRPDSRGVLKEETSMALDPDDPRPEGISLRKAYSAIRKWYQKNIGLPEQRGGNSARGSAALLRALPPSKPPSPLAFRAALTEGISGDLE